MGAAVSFQAKPKLSFFFPLVYIYIYIYIHKNPADAYYKKNRNNKWWEIK
jgi:hypothetical protein